MWLIEEILKDIYVNGVWDFKYDVWIIWWLMMLVVRGELGVCFGGNYYYLYIFFIERYLKILIFKKNYRNLWIFYKL